MDVLIDGASLAELPAGLVTLGQLAAHVRQIVPRSKLVVSIRTDGRLVEPSRIEALLSNPLAQWGRVEFETSSVADTALKVLTSVDEAFCEIEQRQEMCVELLRQGQSAKAREHMAHCFSIWQQTQGSVGKVGELLRIKLDAVEHEGEAFPAILERLRSNLTEVKEALEARDFVFLADILEYELKETAGKFHGVIRSLTEVARRQGGC